MSNVNIIMITSSYGLENETQNRETKSEPDE